MGLFGAIPGIGHTHGNIILRGANTLIENFQATILENDVIIALYTVSGLYVDSITLNSETNTVLDFEFEKRIVGGLKNFSIFLNRKFMIQIYNQMIAVVTYAGSILFRGLVSVVPKQDQSKDVIEYKGDGFINQLSNIKMTKTYTSQTLLYILNDIFTVILLGLTDIIYNIANILPPNITITYEIKNKAVLDVIDYIMQIANINFDSIEYVYYVGKDQQFYFTGISKTTIINSFFEDIDFKNNDNKKSIKDIKNKINIFRPISGSTDLEYVSTIQDNNSIAEYGVKEENITIESYVSQTTAENIASYIISRYKDPITTTKIKKLSMFTEFGMYRVNNRFDLYSDVIDECNNLSSWDLTNIINTTCILEKYYILSGRNSFKITLTTGSTNEYIEYTLSNEMYFIQTIYIWLSFNVTNSTAIKVSAYDNAGTEINTSIYASVNQQFVKYTLSIPSNTIRNIKKIRITFLVDTAIIIYLDRIEVSGYKWSSNDLMLRKLTGYIKAGKVYFDYGLGELDDNAADKIKKLDDKAQNIMSIFEII